HTATTELYTLSLHDALPILTDSFLRRNRKLTDSYLCGNAKQKIMKNIVFVLTLLIGTVTFAQNKNAKATIEVDGVCNMCKERIEDRKSTRLNSSHVKISYAV